MGSLLRLTTLLFKISIVATQMPSPRASSGHTIDPHLSLILQANAQTSQGTDLKETMAWLDNLHSAPACTQLASSSLLADCQLLDNPQEFTEVHPNQVLEDVQNEYALKLAICEYVGAQQSGPKAPPKCQAFLPSREACVKRSWFWGQGDTSDHDICYPRSTKADLSQCLTTMQSSPQTWTSYSNARSRAMHICQLSRHHVEKEKALQLYKNLTLVISKLHESVRPLGSKLQSMEDQLYMYSDDSRRLFEESQQTAKNFTKFAKAAQKQHLDHLKETNETLRHMQSGIKDLQQQANQHYADLNAKFEARMEASLAQNMELIAYKQSDYLAQFATNMELVFQRLNMQLDGQFERYNAELQKYHEKNMLATQQQHETTVQSFNILQSGLDSAASKVDGLSDKTSMLRTELDDTIVQVEAVNDGLHSLGSVAQAAGRFMASFSALFAYLGFAGIVLGLILCANCVSSVPIMGIAFRRLLAMVPALLICGVSSFALSRSSFYISTKLVVHTGFLSAFDWAEQSLPWLKMAVYLLLCACILFVFYEYCSGRILSFFARIPNRYTRSRTSPCQRPTVQLPAPSPTGSVSSTPSNFHSRAFSREILEDEDLLARVRNFQRASTVC